MSPSFSVRDVFSSNAGRAGTSEADGDEDKSGLVYAVGCAFWGCAVLVICMRMYSRRILTRFYGIDDTMILVALVFSTADFVCKNFWYLNGLGVHIKYVSTPEFAVFSKVSFAIAVIYPCSLGLAKISVLLFYHRIFPSHNFKIVIIAAVVFIAAMTVSLTVAQGLSCMPPSQSYALVKDPDGHCINKAALQYAGTVLNLCTDILVLVMPMKYLWALTMDRRRRYGVILLFSSGAVTCIASCIRLKTIYSFYHNTDPTYDAYHIAVWSAIEINLTLITASLAASKPILDKLFFNHLRRHFPNAFPPTASMSKRAAANNKNTSRSFPGSMIKEGVVDRTTTGISTTSSRVLEPRLPYAGSQRQQQQQLKSPAIALTPPIPRRKQEGDNNAEMSDEEDVDSMDFDHFLHSAPHNSQGQPLAAGRQRQMSLADMLRESRNSDSEKETVVGDASDDNVFWSDAEKLAQRDERRPE